ncbi:hypothetical protein [Methyloglobulus sp.]|uniref:hypothetical protein n=1 Tax=Methyloglobulus sp. TaxID=2518622 RepID=UPI0032B75103
MKISIKHFLFYILTVTGLLLVGNYAINSFAQSVQPKAPKLERLFPEDVQSSVTFDKSIIANLLLDLSQGRPIVIVPSSDGEITALDGEIGVLEWKINAPVPEGQEAQLISTPVMIENKLVILYQCLEKGVRTSHRMAVIDLVQKKLDETFPVLVLSAEKPAAGGVASVKFKPPTAFSHSALKHTRKVGTEWGFVYAAFGNAGDTQPFHGWLFEIDMDAWKLRGTAQAISNVLLTTPEAECPVTIESGTQEMICAGGIWTPAGPQLYPTADSFELFVPVGNGQVDLARHDYANTLMRVQPGLQFNPECDAQLCKNFNASQPDYACMSSCKNLFIPRLTASNTFFKPANGECDVKTFWECLAWMDYDLGASAPVKVNLKSGHSVLVQPGKEGAVYLIDANHLGTQYDRLQIVDMCGTPSDPCKAGWMGMIVTQPALTTINDEPVVVIPTFMPDNTHPAGLVALKIVLTDGKPKLQGFWQYPDPASSTAVKKFRSHPSLPVISTLGEDNDAIVWTVDIGNPGTLYGIRVKDGVVLFEQSLLGTGRQLSAPLIDGNTLYLASTLPGTGKAMIEAYQIKTQEQ